MKQSYNQCSFSFKNTLQGIGAMVGYSFGIYASINLKTDDMTTIPYAGKAMAESLPIGFGHLLVPPLVAGTFANYYSNFGSAIDVVVNAMKNLPNGSLADIKQWISQCDAKNVGHVTGALFGLALASYFLYCNSINSENSFSLPYGASNGVQSLLLQIGALPYVSGACSNLFSHFTEGTKNAAINIHSGFKYSHSKLSALFGKCRIKQPSEVELSEIDKRTEATTDIKYDIEEQHNMECK